MKFMKLVGLVAVGLAIVGAFVTIPSLAAVLVILGLISGFVIDGPDHVRVIVSALALTALAGVLNAIPSVGGYLTTIVSKSWRDRGGRGDHDHPSQYLRSLQAIRSRARARASQAPAAMQAFHFHP